MIPNSCASHALLSILLNCDNVKLGPVLEDLKMYSKGMDPDSKGSAIGHYPHLARTHDNHAKPNRLTPLAKGGTVMTTMSSMDAFHYSSFVPINKRLYELDGLKPYPVDHDSWKEGENWTAQFERVIQRRLKQTKDICFNLMAVVHDPIHDIVREVEQCHHTLRSTLEAVSKLNYSDNVIEYVTTLIATSKTVPPEYAELAGALRCVIEAQENLEKSKREFQDEKDIRKGYLLDHARRTHDYNPAIQEFIKALGRHGQLPLSILRRKSLGGQK